MNITITLDADTHEQLKKLANHCEVPETELARILVKDSLTSFIDDRDEFRESLNQS